MFSEPPSEPHPEEGDQDAKTEGIIAISRADALRKTNRNAAKISAAVRLKLSVRVGTRLAPTLAWRIDSPTTCMLAPRNAGSPPTARSQALRRSRASAR